MIKVCHMTTVHERYDGRILKKECVSLANAGYDVTLLVADNLPDENYKNVKISSIDFSPKNRFDRILNSKKQMLKKALLVDADVYHFHDPELIPVGVTLKKKNKKVIFDSHEDYPKDIRNKKRWIPGLVRPAIAFLYQIYEMSMVPKFDGIISVTPQIISRFKLKNNNSVMVTNYPIVIKLLKKKEDKSKYICFCGSISLPWAHDNFVKALQNCSFVEYVFAGPLNDKFLNELQELDITGKIKYIGVINQEEVFGVYSESFAGMSLIHYSPTDNQKQGSLGVTKLFEYMMFGLPVICTDLLLWKKIIDEYDCGITVSPNDIEGISDAIKFLNQNPDIAKRMGENGRRAVVEKYNWESQERVMLSLYEKIL